MSNYDEEPKILPDWKRVFVDRQEFLRLTAVLGTGFITILCSLPGVAFVLNYLFSPAKEKWISLGPAESFPQGKTIDVIFMNPYSTPWDGVCQKRSAWLRRNSKDEFIVFAVNCTHLGCPLRWEDKAELFMCPCHGGVFQSNGDVAAGPPLRPMHQYPVRIVRGQVEIKVREVLDEGRS